MKKTFLLLSALLSISVLFAQIPDGYYNSAQGQTGAQLKTTLHNIIKGHTAQSYTPGVWNAFYTTDKKPNGKVWDIYSDVPGGTPAYEWTFGNDQCGSYSGEGSCYNREHSFPQSWFNKSLPMVTDLFHIYPTDGYVNGKRSSYPYGEVSSPSWTSTNGSKLGSNSTAGYSGTVFEPIDEYKGDLARSYFYMATRYEDVISSWNSIVLDGSTYPVYVEWELDILMRWSQEDPVSQKEVDRNNAIYAIQHNRNPYIDHPEYVAAVWGTASTTPNIGDIHQLPIHPTANDNVTVYANITDNGSIVSAKITYGTTASEGDWQDDMIESGSSYTYSIPAMAEGTQVYYWITATDNDGETSTSANYQYTVGSDQVSAADLPIYEDFENGDLGVFTPVNVVGADQSWIRYTYATTGNSYAKISGWDGSGGTPNEDWLISAQIDFDAYTNESLSFKTSMNYTDATTRFQVLYSTDYSGTGDPNAANWTDLTGEADFSTGNYDWVESGDIDVSEINGSTVSFAYKFVCGTESETWQLDDVSITGTPVETGIDNGISSESLSIYPNPAKQWIYVKGDITNNSSLIIYNYLGQIKYENMLKNSADHKVFVGFLKPGIYIVQLKNDSQENRNLRLVIQ